MSLSSNEVSVTDAFLAQELNVHTPQYITLAEGEIDPRLLQLSYSSRLLLHECPRKYQLYKLNATAAPETESATLTFSYGHIVGEGVQLALQGYTFQEVAWKLFLQWPGDLLDSNPKQKKSFALALAAVQSFFAIRANGFLEDYDLLYIEPNGERIPACELSFRIDCGGGFKYRGFIDAVLVHRVTGEVLVLEIKTTSAYDLNPAQYKNSSQAIGYSIVLDTLFPGISEYQVQYLVFLTKEFEWRPLPFHKTVLDRAGWITEMILDTQDIAKYNALNYFPMRGENCLNKYNRECQYFQECRMSTERITKRLEQAHLDRLAEEVYHYEITLASLITQVQSTLDS